ncbi:MAG: hypothetical protein K8F91_01915 [Candidatus Obscuribacterales bacterium]|nr:hypothetical protein [Candidatus Obscuribacterales bacterium]
MVPQDFQLRQKDAAQLAPVHRIRCRVLKKTQLRSAVGIKNYTEAFNLLGKDVAKGAAEGDINKRLSTIVKSLYGQLRKSMIQKAGAQIRSTLRNGAARKSAVRDSKR